jgi:serine/threonine protein kinase/tetratricopeptide (TPR) repeat protein
MDIDRRRQFSGVEPGMTLGGYRIERMLGRGGMGAVFLAYDTRLHRQVALKVIGNDDDRPASGARLLREARNAAGLNHPNICTIHEVGEVGGTAFIAMEYVAGRSLRERLDEGALPAGEALRLGIQAADALAYAHENGVVHRDFKAANAIVGEGGRLKVVDFGLARRDDARLAEVTTMASLVPAGVVAGTPYTMAPEQVRGEAADVRSDIWSLGVLLYEMVTSARPFTGRTIPELFSSILTKPLTPLPATVPIELRSVIERCLHKDPARRYERARDVRTALDAIAAGTVTPWVSWGYHLRRRPVSVTVAALTGVILILAGFNVGGLRDRLMGIPPDEPPIRLAVLPFRNLTGDPDQEYFSDGLTDEMITQLGRLQPPRLSVIARTSSMRYKGRDEPIDQIARELGADYVMEGSFRRDGNRVRISATLIDAGDQTQRWSETFESEVADILALQSGVAVGVARALAIALLPAEQLRMASTRPVNSEAYEAYLRGRFHWQMLGPNDLDTAMRYFQLAIQKDPDYAAAYTGIGVVWGLRCNTGVTPCPEALPKWKDAILKARKLDPDLPEVQGNIAAIAFYADWDWVAAEREFQRAIDLDPTDPDTRMWYADFLQSVGRFDEAIAEVRRILELDPQNSLYQAQLGRTLLNARRDDEGIAVLRDVLKTDPGRRSAQVQLQHALARKGMYEEAFAMMQRLSANNPRLLEALNRAYAEGGYQKASRVRADEAARQSQDAFGVAAFYARAQEKALALDWLEKGFEQRGPGIVNLRVDPSWDFLAGDPRFEAMLARMKFPN